MTYNFSPTFVTSDSPFSPVPYIPSSFPLISNVNNTPIVTTTNPLVSFPIHPSLDLNRDPELRKMVTKYFYYKTLDKWLKKEKYMLDILNYLKYSNGKVSLINNISEYNPVNNDDADIIDSKVDFIEKNILDKDDVYNILSKYVRETGTNWYDLEEKGTFFIREIIHKYLEKKLKKAVEIKSR